MLPLKANVDFAMQPFDTEREKDTSCFLLPSHSLFLSPPPSKPLPLFIWNTTGLFFRRCLPEQHLIHSERHYQLMLSCQWIRVAGSGRVLKGSPEANWPLAAFNSTSSCLRETETNVTSRSQKHTSDPLAYHFLCGALNLTRSATHNLLPCMANDFLWKQREGQSQWDFHNIACN